MFPAGKLEKLRLVVNHLDPPVTQFPIEAVKQFVTRRTSTSGNAVKLRALVVPDARDLPWLESHIDSVRCEGPSDEVDATSLLGHYPDIYDFSEYDEENMFAIADGGDDWGYGFDADFYEYMDEEFGNSMDLE